MVAISEKPPGPPPVGPAAKPIQNNVVLQKFFESFVAEVEECIHDRHWSKGCDSLNEMHSIAYFTEPLPPIQTSSRDAIQTELLTPKENQTFSRDAIQRVMEATEKIFSNVTALLG